MCLFKLFFCNLIAMKSLRPTRLKDEASGYQMQK